METGCSNDERESVKNIEILIKGDSVENSVIIETPESGCLTGANYSNDVISFYSPAEYLEKNRERDLVNFPKEILGIRENGFIREKGDIRGNEDIGENEEIPRCLNFVKNEKVTKLVVKEDQNQIESNLIKVEGLDCEEKEIMFNSTGDKEHNQTKEEIIERILEESEKVKITEDQKIAIDQWNSKKRLKSLKQSFGFFKKKLEERHQQLEEIVDLMQQLRLVQTFELWKKAINTSKSRRKQKKS
jgi:hypothetical protein